MLTWVGNHPFWFGVGTSLVLSVALFSDLIDVPSTAQTRGLGLMVFGGAIAILLYQTRDRNDVFWFLLGGVITTVVSFFVSLKF